MNNSALGSLVKLRKPHHLFWAVLIVLLVFNLNRIIDPPFWDGILGVYAQGNWLANNGFDFFALFKQPGYTEGGPLVQLFYVYAPLFGILSKWFPPTYVFLFLHLLNFVLSAWIIVTVFNILKEIVSVPIALLICTAGSLNPIFNGQMAGTYLEIPMTAFLTGALFYVWQKNYFLATLFCFLAYLMKPAALLFGVALVTHGLALITTRKLINKSFSAFNWREWGTTTVLLVILVIMGRFSSILVDVPSISLFQKINGFTQASPFLYPDLILIAVLIFLLYFICLMTKEFKQWSADKLNLLLFLFILIASFWASVIYFGWAMPRYVTLIVFPQMLALALLTHKKRSFILSITFILIIFGTFNLDGRLLKPLPLNQLASGNLLERSREYLQNLDENRKICRFIEEKYSDWKLITSPPFTQMLTIPAFGYVKRGLPAVYATSSYALDPKVESHRQLINTKDEKALIVHSKSNLQSMDRLLKPHPNDVIYYAVGKNKFPHTILFKKN